MRMTIDHLLANAVGHIVHGEPSSLGLNLCMEHDLQQHVAQFFLKQNRVIIVDGFDCLVGLLDEAAANGLVILLAIPDTALRAAQNAHDLQQIFIRIFFFECKIYHDCFPSFPGKDR